MNDNEVKVAKNRIWAGTALTGLIIVCGLVWGMQITAKNKRLEEFLENQKEASDQRMDQLWEDVRVLDQIVNKIRITAGDTRPVPPLIGNSIHLEPQSDFYPDSVPCCGEPVPLETTQPTSTIENPPSENNSVSINNEEEIEKLTSNLPEKDRNLVRQTMQELNEFRSTLNEEDLSRLDNRIAFLKRKQKAQWLSMVASFPPDKRAEAEKQVLMMEQAMKHPIEMQALMEMEQEKIMEADAEEAKNREIRVTLFTEEQLKIVQERENMRKAMEMIEEAAGGNLGDDAN